MDLPLDEAYTFFRSAPTVAEIEDVFRQTFAIVARNTDRLIERLPEWGYRFECEVGRHGEPNPPRRPCGDACLKAKESVEDRFGDSADITAAWPLALTVFAEFVGNVDLRQRFAPHQTSGDWTQSLQVPTMGERPEALGHTLSSEELKSFVQGLSDIVEEHRDADEEARLKNVAKMDDNSHLYSDDPVISRLGNWDPLEINFDYLAYDLTEDEHELAPLRRGGLALVGEFAASFEHKANVSGAENPWFAFPANRDDPIVHAEGIELPFSTYLRRVFQRGGFHGVPRPIFDGNPNSLREVEAGIFLPDHDIFASLARDMEPF